jgi:hypothetical protein
MAKGSSKGTRSFQLGPHIDSRKKFTLVKNSKIAELHEEAKVKRRRRVEGKILYVCVVDD